MQKIGIFFVLFLITTPLLALLLWLATLIIEPLSFNLIFVLVVAFIISLGIALSTVK